MTKTCRRRLAWRCLTLAVLVSLSGCSSGKPYRTAALIFDAGGPAMLGNDPDELRVAQVVANVIRDRLRLPFPEETTIRVYVNQATFAEGLARDGGQVTDEAWDRARMAAAVASQRGLFLRGDLVNSMRLMDRVGLIAHEIAHVNQMEMRRGGRGAPAHWIREGHAEWVRFQVLEALGMRTYAESREEVMRSMLRSTTPIRFFPMLTDLSGGAKWTETNIRLGSAATYGQAFLAVDWLVERYGIESLEQFNRRFATDGEPRSHWAAVYPISFAEFVREFRERLERLGASSQ